MPVWEKSSPAGVKDSGDGGTSVRVCRSERREGERECGGTLKRKAGPADAFYSLFVCVCAETADGKPDFCSRCLLEFGQIIVFILVLLRSLERQRDRSYLKQSG